MGSPSEHTDGTTIVTLTMNPALEVTTSADRGPDGQDPLPRRASRASNPAATPAASRCSAP